MKIVSTINLLGPGRTERVNDDENDDDNDGVKDDDDDNLEESSVEFI